MTSIQGFQATLDSFKGDVDNKGNQLLRKVALQTLSGVVLKTPVDTGRARGNWQVSLSTPLTNTVTNDDTSGNKAIAVGSGKILSLIHI